MLVKQTGIHSRSHGDALTTKTIECAVPAGEGGQRLDRWLADNLEDMSRSRLQALISDGMVAHADGKPVSDGSAKTRAGQVFRVSIPPPVPALPTAQNIPLEILFEDEHLIVLDKPVGLVVHPAPGHPDGTLVNALLYHCADSLSGIGGVTRPGIVHRLDKDTSGIMVCAKSDVAHRGLVEQFQVHSIERAYFAVVWGCPEPRHGEIDSLIGRDPKNRKRMAVVQKLGKAARTAFDVIRPIGSVASLVDCQLFTGRTHQIRVHMSSIGHPLIGDPFTGHGANRGVFIRRNLRKSCRGRITKLFRHINSVLFTRYSGK
jgi:23S rRNA pseudouridine1911/1915/1917 synthase